MRQLRFGLLFVRQKFEREFKLIEQRKAAYREGNIRLRPDDCRMCANRCQAKRGGSRPAALGTGS